MGIELLFQKTTELLSVFRFIYIKYPCSAGEVKAGFVVKVCVGESISKDRGI